VFVAKKSTTCGLVQKSHQHVVLPAISSGAIDVKNIDPIHDTFLSPSKVALVSLFLSHLFPLFLL
jgi:hypothetical protein